MGATKKMFITIREEEVREEGGDYIYQQLKVKAHEVSKDSKRGKSRR